MSTTLFRGLRRLILGLAATATLTVTGAAAANATDIYANRTDGHVTSLYMVTSAQETQDLVDGGYGFGSAGNMLCATQVVPPLSWAMYWVDVEPCGHALTSCAKRLADGQHPDQVAAVEWIPQSRGWLGGQWTCVTWQTGPSALARIVQAAQTATNGG